MNKTIKITDTIHDLITILFIFLVSMMLISDEITNLKKGRSIIESEMNNDPENFIISISFEKIASEVLIMFRSHWQNVSIVAVTLHNTFSH